MPRKLCLSSMKGEYKMTPVRNFCLAVANIIMIAVSTIAWWTNGDSHSPVIFVMWFILLGITIAMVNFAEDAQGLTDKSWQELNHIQRRCVSRYNALCTLQIIFWTVQPILIIWAFCRGDEQNITLGAIWLCFTTLNLIYGLIDKTIIRLKFGRRKVRITTYIEPVDDDEPKGEVKFDKIFVFGGTKRLHTQESAGLLDRPSE